MRRRSCTAAARVNASAAPRRPRSLSRSSCAVLALRLVPNRTCGSMPFSSTSQASIGAAPYAVSPMRRSGVRSKHSSTRSIITLVDSTSAVRLAGVANTGMAVRGERPRYCIDAMEDRSFMSSDCLCVSVLANMLLSCVRKVSSLTPSTSEACLVVSPAYTRCVTRTSAAVNP